MKYHTRGAVRCDENAPLKNLIAENQNKAMG